MVFLGSVLTVHFIPSSISGFGSRLCPLVLTPCFFYVFVSEVQCFDIVLIVLVHR
jgi:hypothetical protein